MALREFSSKGWKAMIDPDLMHEFGYEFGYIPQVTVGYATLICTRKEVHIVTRKPTPDHMPYEMLHFHAIFDTEEEASELCSKFAKPGRFGTDDKFLKESGFTVKEKTFKEEILEFFGVKRKFTSGDFKTIIYNDILYKHKFQDRKGITSGSIEKACLMWVENEVHFLTDGMGKPVNFHALFITERIAQKVYNTIVSDNTLQDGFKLDDEYLENLGFEKYE